MQKRLEEQTDLIFEMESKLSSTEALLSETQIKL